MVFQWNGIYYPGNDSIFVQSINNVFGKKFEENVQMCRLANVQTKKTETLKPRRGDMLIECRIPKQ